MKNLTITVLTLMLFISFSFVSKHAYADDDHGRGNDDEREVAGMVKGVDGKAASGVLVTVACSGHTKTTHTNRKGKYEVDIDDCKKTDSVTATGSKDGATGGGSSNANGEHVNISFQLSAASVPEFGLITGALALGGSLGGFALLKNKFD